MLLVTIQIGAVHISDRRDAAMCAVRDRQPVFGMVDRHGDALVEYITKSVPQSSLYPFIFSVRDDAAVQLRHVFEAFAEHECGQFFATDAPRAVRKNGLVLLISEILTDPSRKIAK